MKRTILIILLFSMLLLSITLVYAHGNFNETKKLVDSGISCDELRDEQLESIGDYYMEQMHPGEAHEMMHKMMGGEDSETTKLMHVNMAKSIYCGETNQGMMGMMNMMSTGDNNGGMISGYDMMGSGDNNDGMMQGGMMNSGGMMNMMGGQNVQSDEMMENYYQTTQNNPYQNNFLGFQVFFYIIQILIIVILILMIMLSINKLKNNVKQGGNNKHGRQQ